MQILNMNQTSKLIRQMNTHQKNMNILALQIASGNRLVNGGIDPSGLAIATKMTAQINGLTMASRNAQDAISMVQAADGALESVVDMIQEMKEKALEAANDTLTTSERDIINDEINQLREGIEDILNNFEYNGKKLFSGDYDFSSDGLWIQTGANAGQGTKLYFNELSLDAVTGTLAGIRDFDITGKSATDIMNMLSDLDKDFDTVIGERGRMGSYVKRMEYTINSLEHSIDNLSESRSRITDTDMAQAVSEYMREQFLMQASTTMLSSMFDHQQQMLNILLGQPRW